MSPAIDRFAKFLQFSGQMLARAERDDLEECAHIWLYSVPIIVRSLASCQWAASGSLIGFEVVGVLGVLEQEQPRH